MLIKHAARAGLTLLVVCLIGSTAIANTIYSFSGQNCVSNSQTTIQYDSTGAYNSSASAAITLWCPMVGHEADDIDIVDYGVNYTDNSSSLGFDCKLHVRTQTGTLYTSSSQTTTAGFTGSGALSESDPVNSGSTVNNIASYVIECTVPDDSSYIRRYWVTQVSP